MTLPARDIGYRVVVCFWPLWQPRQAVNLPSRRFSGYFTFLSESPRSVNRAAVRSKISVTHGSLFVLILWPLSTKPVHEKSVNSSGSVYTLSRGLGPSSRACGSTRDRKSWTGCNRIAIIFYTTRCVCRLFFLNYLTHSSKGKVMPQAWRFLSGGLGLVGWILIALIRSI